MPLPISYHSLQLCHEFSELFSLHKSVFVNHDTCICNEMHKPTVYLYPGMYTRMCKQLCTYRKHIHMAHNTACRHRLVFTCLLCSTTNSELIIKLNTAEVSIQTQMCLTIYLNLCMNIHVYLTSRTKSSSGLSTKEKAAKSPITCVLHLELFNTLLLLSHLYGISQAARDGTRRICVYDYLPLYFCQVK